MGTKILRRGSLFHYFEVKRYPGGHVERFTSYWICVRFSHKKFNKKEVKFDLCREESTVVVGRGSPFFTASKTVDTVRRSRLSTTLAHRYRGPKHGRCEESCMMNVQSRFVERREKKRGRYSFLLSHVYYTTLGIEHKNWGDRHTEWKKMKFKENILFTYERTKGLIEKEFEMDGRSEKTVCFSYFFPSWPEPQPSRSKSKVFESYSTYWNLINKLERLWTKEVDILTKTWSTGDPREHHS